MSKLATHLTAFLGIFSVAHVSAQEAMREMLNNRAMPGPAQFENQDYTFKVKDLRVLVTPSFGVDYNDNIGISDKGSSSDFILRPMVSTTGIYPITARNVLTFSVGVGYEQYIEHDDYSGLSLSTGSGVSFDIGIGDFQINLHDRFSYSQDAAGQSAIAGNGQNNRYGTANNTIGLSAAWDLGDVTVTGGYDHRNLMSTSQTSETYQSQDHSSEMFFQRVGLRVHPEITTGVEGSETLTAYDKQVLNNNKSYTAGVFADWRPGDFSIEPRVGYSIFQYEQTSSSIQTSSSDSWYADLTATAPITKVISASVSGGHEVRLGIQSDAVESYYFRPGMSWGIIEGGSLHFGLSYEKGKQGVGNKSGNLQETYDYYGANIGFNYGITKRLTGSLNYRVTLRSSNGANRDYTQNLVSLQLSYPLR